MFSVRVPLQVCGVFMDLQFDLVALYQRKSLGREERAAYLLSSKDASSLFRVSTLSLLSLVFMLLLLVLLTIVVVAGSFGMLSATRRRTRPVSSAMPRR